MEAEKVITVTDVVTDFTELCDMLLADEFEHITMWEGEAGGYQVSRDYRGGREDNLEKEGIQKEQTIDSWKMERRKIMTNRITGRRIGLACGVFFCFFLWYLGIPEADVAVSQFKINSDMDMINDKLRTELGEVQNKTAEIAEAAKTVKERQQSIEQLKIQGRIAEETELINYVIAETWDEIQEFLCDTTKRGAAYQWISIYRFDITGDGAEEIILSKEFVDTSAIFAYQYIFDCQGNKLLEFAWGPGMEIYTKEGEEGVFYIRDYIHLAASSDLWLYGEIRENEGTWEEELIYMEWDTRHGAERINNEEEGYGIYAGFDEDGNDIFKGIVEGIAALSKKKEQVDADVLEKYLEGQNAVEREQTRLGYIIYHEPEDTFEGGASDGLRKLWQENDLPTEEIPDYLYFANAGEGHYRPWRENEVAFAVKKYAGMTGMENEAWELKRVNYVDGLYHAYVESETGNELYILLSEETGLETFIIAVDIRQNGEADVLLQDERYSYNSALTWYSYADWFYGEKTHEGTISFERKGEFLDHMYADGCSYAICDYLERIGGGWDSEWTIEENLMYVGTNGYIADAYCTNGEKELSLLIDVWNHCYAVIE